MESPLRMIFGKSIPRDLSVIGVTIMNVKTDVVKGRADQRPFTIVET